MDDMDFEGRYVNTATLAYIFDVSERQIQRLVKAGVISTCTEDGKPYLFDLTVVIIQYSQFLYSGIPMNKWAPSI